MRQFLLYFFLLGSTACFAQVQTAVLELTDANVYINSNGKLFNNLASNLGGYEVPAGSMNNSIYTSSLWVSGLDSLNNLHTAAITYCQENEQGFCEYFPGPLKTDGSASTTSEVSEAYNRFWFASKDQIDEHTVYFNCVNDPDCDAEIQFPDYIIPQEILEWPAHGDTQENYSYNLAPYVDIDGDGSYQPENGDYPSIVGDKAVYIISNDNAGVHLNSFGEPLGIEVHTLIYYFLDDDPALSRTIYVHQDIINRSEMDYHDVYTGIWNDFDLGNPTDDFVGTDVENSFIYVYNGSEIDQGSSAGPGYGDDLPMMACKILAGPYADFNGIDDLGPFDGSQEYGDYTKGWNDGIIDNERLGLSSSIFFSSGFGPLGQPQISEEFFSNLRSIWRDGVPVTYGGTGYNPSQTSALESKYVFSGLSDPFFLGTDGVDPNDPSDEGWTEISAEMIPGDRRMNANCGPFTLKSGQKQSIDYMYVFARQSDNPDEDLFNLLTEYVNFAAENIDSLPTGVISSVKRIQAEEIGFRLFPNPAGDQFTLTLSGNESANYRIYNLLGSQVRSGVVKSGKSIVNITGLERGLYLVNIAIGNRFATQKLIVE